MVVGGIIINDTARFHVTFPLGKNMVHFLLESASSSVRRRASWKSFFFNVSMFCLGYGAALQLISMLRTAVPDPKAHPPLDLRLGFPAEAVATVLEAYGQEGRMLYTYLELIDFVFMYGYSMLLSTLLSAGLSVAPFKSMRALNLLPVTAVVVDVVENSTMLVILATYPSMVDTLAPVAAFANKVKWHLLYATVSVMFGTGFYCLYKSLSVAAKGGQQQQQQEEKQPQVQGSKTSNPGKASRSRKKT
jgi:hypothetical protein